jgi:methionyl aminopeptidase
VGVKLDGWCADAAVTWPVGEIDAEKRKLLDITEGALRIAIDGIGRKQRWSQVAREMEAHIRAAGFGVVEEYTGHGIGREMWEDVQVPNYTNRKFERQEDFALEPGLVIAVEPMVNAGTKNFIVRPDHWTVVTADGKPSAHFEHTIAVTARGPLVLTAGPDGQGWALGGA